jgi:hypothetical protein
MKAGLAILAGCLLSGCENPLPEPNRCQHDQDVRREIFMECLRAVPQGPVSAKYNDWSEVVDQCGDQAGYISLRGCADTRAKETQEPKS